MVCITFGDEYVKKIEQIPTPYDAIRKRIHDMSKDIIKKHVFLSIKNCGQLSLQLYETTDVSDYAQMMACLRYPGHIKMEEEFIFCHSMTTNTMGESFNLTDTFFKDEGLSLDQCHRICTNGSKINGVNSQVKVFHYLLHRENIASKRLSDDIKIVMKEVVQAVNFIIERSLNNIIFSQMCLEMGSEHNHLYHSEVRLLSQGNVFQRAVALRMILVWKKSSFKFIVF
ncbi:UNVERIFIED_CONTAM: hypothetical protein RMT77_010069 [Armadillidium vulgare]